MAALVQQPGKITVPAGPLSFATDVKTLGIGAFLIAGTAIGSYYLIKKEAKGIQQEQAASNSLVSGTAENYALRMRMALKNDHWYQWWPDFPSLLKIYREIPTKSFFRQVVARYKELYKESLDTLIKDKLKQSEFAQVMEIYRKKPETISVVKKA